MSFKQGPVARMPAFRRQVWAQYKTHGRHDLPWRATRDPYRILVSEIMLQQTQVDRVKPFYEHFLEKFSTAKALASAPLSEVLRAWQGLGYNRRAKMLHAAAKKISEYGFPRNARELEALPGVGPYTARAVAAFAFNADDIFIETNIRTVIIHHFFTHRRKVSDAEIARVLTQALPKGKSREWYYALMDYGSRLKRAGVRTNGRSKHYTKQAAFSGSVRQARGAILREVTKGSASEKRLLGLLGDDRTAQLRRALEGLRTEGLIAKHGRTYVLPR